MELETYTTGREPQREPAQATRWSMVARLEHGDEATRRAALESLLQTYLPVLSWYVQRHPGLDLHQREDLVQGFVASRIIERDLLARADRSRGRFRTFLLNAFQNYVRDELRRASAAKRMPAGGPPLPLEEADGVAMEPAAGEQALQREWVRQVVTLAVTGMEAECEHHQRTDVWSIFRSRLLNPILEGAEPEAYGTVVKRLGLASPSQASNLLITAKRMFARHLQRVVEETVDDPAMAANELEALKKCL